MVFRKCVENNPKADVFCRHDVSFGACVLTSAQDEPRCKPDGPIYIDAANPERYYTHAQAKTTIRQLCAGFRAAGLQKGDTVCVHSFNNVSHTAQCRLASYLHG